MSCEVCGQPRSQNRKVHILDARSIQSEERQSICRGIPFRGVAKEISTEDEYSDVWDYDRRPEIIPIIYLCINIYI